MGNWEMPRGIETHGTKLRIVFHINGKRHRETLDLKVSKANVKAALRLREQILVEIRAGIFDYTKHFPDSVHAGPKVDGKTFRDVAITWIDSLDELAYSTSQGYMRILRTHYLPVFGGISIDQISHGMCRQLIAGKKWKTAKTRNNVLSVLKSIFQYAKQDGYIQTNPTDNINFKKLQKPEPDPFSLLEIETILPCFDKIEWQNYFEFNFFSGLRTSETIALTWGDIDFIHGYVRVNKAKVRKQLKETKTYEARDVMLNARSIEALLRQKNITIDDSKYVFLNPETNEPINDDKPPRVAWNEAIKMSEIRRRPPYNTRHSYATMLLMSGENIAWIARQLGHSVQMLLSRYTRWIDGDDKRSDGKLLNNFLDSHQENVNNINKTDIK